MFRAEHGQPICYCCLQAGHVANYFWDRRLSIASKEKCDQNAPAIVASFTKEQPWVRWIDNTKRSGQLLEEHEYQVRKLKVITSGLESNESPRLT